MTRIVCVSDLHENWIDTPPCDLLLVAGDLTYGFRHDYVSQQKALVTDFRDWVVDQPAKHVVAIAGNHDQSVQAWGWPIQGNLDGKLTYLQDSGAEIEGFKVWGTPWQPWFYDWAFNSPKKHAEKFLREKFALIPKDTDIIICHGPPHGYGDHEVDGMYEELGYPGTPKRSGSRALLAAIRRVNPALMVCGHIHQGYGVYNLPGKKTTIANAAVVNYKYTPVNKPLVFDIEDGKIVNAAKSDVAVVEPTS